MVLVIMKPERNSSTKRDAAPHRPIRHLLSVSVGSHCPDSRPYSETKVLVYLEGEP